MVAATALDCVGLSQNQVNDLTAELDELKSVDWPPGLKDEARACLALECADGSDICISKVCAPSNSTKCGQSFYEGLTWTWFALGLKGGVLEWGYNRA